MPDQISQSLQENIIVLLIFNKEALPLLCNSISPDLFESFIYRNIATKAINFYLEFKAPIADHISDEFEAILNGTERGKAELYRETLEHIYENRDCVNTEYVLSQLNKFIRQQKLKIGIITAAELVEQGKLDEAELILNESRKDQLSIFDPGIKLSNVNNFLSFFDIQDDYFLTGIKQLDTIGICPAPKELFTFIGLSNRGKTWFLIHLTKYALLQRKKVLHISLEMSQEKICKRYAQNFFSISNRDEFFKFPMFERDDLGRFIDINFERMKARANFLNSDIKKELQTKLARLRNKNLVIKDFPTGSLTIIQLKAYLENLMASENFIPDLILLDEPDLMKINPSNKRAEIGRIYVDLRGLANEYNLAMVPVSQINRTGVNATWIDSKFLAEDFSKFFTSDNLISYNQTDMEYEKNLARLFVVKGRNDRKGDKILITQNYGCGQFCLDSIRMVSKYWEVLKEED